MYIKQTVLIKYSAIKPTCYMRTESKQH